MSNSTASQSHHTFLAAVAFLTLAFGALSIVGADSQSVFAQYWGDHVTAGAVFERPQQARRADDVVRRWNEVMLHSNALDHTPVPPGDSRVSGQQLGPVRTARAFAIVHVAMFDAFSALVGGYKSYTGLAPEPVGRGKQLQAAIDAAVSTAAHDTLVALYPSHAGALAEQLEDELERLPAGESKSAGIALGRRAAAAILTLRAGDGADHAEPRIPEEFQPSNQPGFWRPDPISQIPIALGARWSAVTPFVLQSVHQFPHLPPPSLQSVDYAEAFNEVKSLGGDGVVTPTLRTADQTIAGVYWGYDGTPGLGTPPRLYNQIARKIADERGTGSYDLARLLALLNVAMADVGIACWDAKYTFQFWRPVTGVREADTGTGPTGLGDGNPATVGDPTFTPLGAPASNLKGPNFTPPFPAYESGHSAFGSVLFQTLRNFYGTDHIRFTFVSDEYNGVTTDNMGVVRPRLPRTFGSLSAAEEENGQSRIYLGIHWAFDKSGGRVSGRNVANYVFETVFVRQRQ